MPSTLLLDQTEWDLVLDANGNIAVAAEPYAAAQDAASAIRTFLGECWLDTNVGVPYLQRVFGKGQPSLALLKGLLQDAALTVPGVASAQVWITSLQGRTVGGQVQVTLTSGQTSALVPFQAINPQGTG